MQPKLKESFQQVIDTIRAYTHPSDIEMLSRADLVQLSSTPDLPSPPYLTVEREGKLFQQLLMEFSDEDWREVNGFVDQLEAYLKERTGKNGSPNYQMDSQVLSAALLFYGFFRTLPLYKKAPQYVMEHMNKVDQIIVSFNQLYLEKVFRPETILRLSLTIVDQWIAEKNTSNAA